jgi:NAD(P)-dependent dehydrogenase (short-subunit alcohol dehydrogenase family)
LKRGDKVIATARNVDKIKDLQELGAAVLQLDVTAPLAELNKVAEAAEAIYGRVDNLINNAGYLSP